MFRKLAVLSLALASFAILAAPNALAERPLMVFKTNAPLEIPGRVLKPGTYTLVNLNSIGLNGPIGIQNARGDDVGQFLMEPVRRANIASNGVLKLEKQENAPARIESFIPAGGTFGYKFVYPNRAVQPEGTTVAKDVSLGKIESNG